MPWIGVYHGEIDLKQWTWSFFLYHVRAGEHVKRCKAVERTIFFTFNYLFEIYIWNWQIIGLLWFKTHYFSQFITKMGFRCKILSLNDLTPSPISWLGTHCLWCQQAIKPVMTTRAFPGETSITLRLCWKSGGHKKVLVMIGYHSIYRFCQFSMISQILEEIHL